MLLNQDQEKVDVRKESRYSTIKSEEIPMARKKGCKHGKLKNPTKGRKCKKKPKGKKK